MGRGGTSDSNYVTCGAVVGFGIALVVLIAGVCFLVASTMNTRDDKVAEYRNSIVLWNSVGREEYTLATPYVFSLPDGYAQLSENTEADPEQDSLDEGEVPTYTALKYTRTGRLFDNPSWDQDSGEFSSTVSFRVVDSNHTTANEETLGPYKFYMTKVISANKKVCHYQYRGSWVVSKSHCETYWKAKSMCFVVERNSTEFWNFGHKGGLGCNPDEGYEPITYEQVDGTEVSYESGKPPEGEVSFDTLVVTVRSGADPYLVALEVTDTRQGFGQSQHAQLWIGVTLMVVSCLLLIPACCFVGQMLVDYLRMSMVPSEEFDPADSTRGETYRNRLLANGNVEGNQTYDMSPYGPNTDNRNVSGDIDVGEVSRGSQERGQRRGQGRGRSSRSSQGLERNTVVTQQNEAFAALPVINTYVVDLDEEQQGGVPYIYQGDDFTVMKPSPKSSHAVAQHHSEGRGGVESINEIEPIMDMDPIPVHNRNHSPVVLDAVDVNGTTQDDEFFTSHL